jgi:RNA polymerase sigma factor (sigma-70 family)
MKTTYQNTVVRQITSRRRAMTPAKGDAVANQVSQLTQHLRGALLRQDGAGLTDGQLLNRFVEYRDEAAFAALVRRHAPMVWGVCRRLLSHHDAEDAFQATFLVLAKKAAGVVPREMVANWLYGVAHQTALLARRTAARKAARERQVTQMPDPAAEQPDQWSDLRPLLDQELSRLPDKYRAVVVLCDLEGKTRKDVARMLGCPEGTVAGRLARARAMLAKRLARHGLAVSGGALAAALSQQATSAGVPASVVSCTIKAARLLAAGPAAAGVISANVAALTEGVLKTMLVTKLKVAGVALLAVTLIGLGMTLTAYRTLASDRGGTADDAATNAVSGGRANQVPEAEGPRADATGRGVGGEERQAKGGPPEGRAGDDTKLRGLLKERLEAVQKLADRVKELNKQRAATREEVWHADLRVYKAELDLCETTKERIAVLEKIADVYKQMEDHASVRVKQQAASSESLIEAKISRLEAEIAVERERAKLATSPK